MPPRPASRPWPVTLGSLLILAQGACFLLLGVLGLAAVVGISRFEAIIPVHQLPPELRTRFADPIALLELEAMVFVQAVLGLTLGLFLISNGLRFWQRRPQAWPLAMLLQGLNLAVALALYVNGQRSWVFFWMLSSVLIVFHLNRDEVMTAFHRRPPRPETLE